MLPFFKKYKIEIVIFVLAILARIFLLGINLGANNGNFEKTIHGADSFFEVSQNLYKGDGFSIDGVSPSLIHVPLYPFFLALSLFLFGNYFFAVALQIIIGSLIPLLASRLSFDILHSRKVAIFVGFFIALEPNFILFSFIFFAETLFIFFFLLSLLFFIRYLERGQIKLLIFFTVLLGLTSLIKPVVQFFPLFLLPVMLWFLRKRFTWKTLLTHSVLFVCLFVTILSPWIYRNYKEFGTPGMTIMPSLNLYATLAPSVLSIEQGVSFEEARMRFINDRNVDVSRLTFSTASEFNDEAFGVLKKYPVSFAKVVAINVFTFFTHDRVLSALQYAGFSPEKKLSGPAIVMLFESPKELLETIIANLSSPFLLVLIMRIFWIITTILFFAGAILLFYRKKMTAPIVFALVTVLYFAFTTPSNGLTVNGRFRMPVNPIILTIASYPLMAIFLKKKKQDGDN